VVLAFIGLGSNLQDPVQQIHQALQELTAIPQSRCLGHSALYRSAPLVSPHAGPREQPDFINAVAALETGLHPLALLEALQALEQRHGRVRGEHWGPRTLDLDLLLYGDQVINNERLTIPHPGLYDRNFVLYPLQEIASEQGMEIQIPGGGDLAALLKRCPPHDLEKVISNN